MTTSHSPLRQLKAQADAIAAKIKAFERGDPVNDPTGKLAAAKEREAIKVGVVMDDKLLQIELPWDVIRASSEASLSAWILRYMRGQRDPVH